MKESNRHVNSFYDFIILCAGPTPSPPSHSEGSTFQAGCHKDFNAKFCTISVEKNSTEFVKMDGNKNEHQCSNIQDLIPGLLNIVDPLHTESLLIFENLIKQRKFEGTSDAISEGLRKTKRTRSGENLLEEKGENLQKIISNFFSVLMLQSKSQ